jgi:hypothetical protein
MLVGESGSGVGRLDGRFSYAPNWSLAHAFRASTAASLAAMMASNAAIACQSVHAVAGVAASMMTSAIAIFIFYSPLRRAARAKVHPASAQNFSDDALTQRFGFDRLMRAANRVRRFASARRGLNSAPHVVPSARASAAGEVRWNTKSP